MKTDQAFEELIKIFGSKAKAQEMFFILSGIKKVIRQGFFEEESKDIEDFCKNNKIVCVKSKFKVILDSDNNSRYSNKGTVVDISDKKRGMIYFYMSKDEKSAYMASLFEIENKAKEFGIILGYPRCCIEFFENNWSKTNSNPEQKPTNPYTNITKRKEDYVLISHFPCSSDCKESIELGKKYHEELKRMYPEYAKIIIKKLAV